MISVCLATYNGERFIRQQLMSILAQLSAEDEIIISDDGSSDSTVSIIRSFCDPRIKIFRNYNGKGVNNNFRNAISHASGDIIFFSDQDNIWLSDKINVCLQHIQEADCILHDCMITDSDLNVTSESLQALTGKSKSILHNFARNCFTGCCMCISRALLSKIPPIPDTACFYYDQWIGIWSIIIGKVSIIPDRLILFRRHDGTISSCASKSNFSLLKKFKYRFYLIFKIIQASL